nr:MAG TPA: hypothetical protein [Caudoviricetes sp.]
MKYLKFCVFRNVIFISIYYFTVFPRKINVYYIHEE